MAEITIRQRQAERECDLVREQLRDEEAGVRQISSSAPYSMLSEADEIGVNRGGIAGGGGAHGGREITA
jgi:hypothetical protein